MITEGDATILLETTWRAFGNQSQSKQRSTLIVDRKLVIKFIFHNKGAKISWLQALLFSGTKSSNILSVIEFYLAPFL